MSHLWEIIKGILSNALFFLIITIAPSIWLVCKLWFNYSIRISLMLVMMLIFVFLSVIISLTFNRRRLSIYNGRDNIFKANLKLLKETRNLKKKKYILSTRISYWGPEEESKVRNEFRNWLSKRIQFGFLMKRIWQIQCTEDIEKMCNYLELYKKYDNYNLKCFVGKNNFIPEILANSGIAISISIPQSENPRKIVTSFHYFGKKEVVFWEDYFNLIWDQSISIKIGNNIYYEEIQKIRELLM